jgi:hypothetical protein
MGLLSLLGAKQKVTFIQSAQPGAQDKVVFTIDCTVSESHSRESPPTEFPVEDGTTVSDFILVRPFQLELHGIISDTPLSLINSLLTTGATAIVPSAGIIAASGAFALYSALAKTRKPSVVAFGQLLQLQASRQPFDVLTSLQRYPSMWIKSLTVPRDAQTGDVLNFQVQLVQLIVVSPQTVNIRQFANPSLAAGASDVGTQQLQDKGVSTLQKGIGDGLNFSGVSR